MSTSTMSALVLADGQLRVENNYPRPRPGPSEALLKVRLAGICSTDLEILRGYVPGFDGVLGHEFVADVISAPDPRWVGKRVGGTINVGCGACAECAGHGPEHCARRRVLGIIDYDGVMADYVTLPVSNLVAVPANVTDEEAVFVEPLAAALRILEQLTVPPTAKIAVVGPGRLGLLIGQVMGLNGATVTLLGRSTASLHLPDRLGLATGLVEAAPNDGFDIVVEATGNEAGLAHALRLVRPRGTLVMKSTFSGPATIDLTKLVVGEISVMGSRCGPFAPAYKLLAAGRIQVRPLLDATYTLAEAPAAFDHADQPGVRKVLLRPTAES